MLLMQKVTVMLILAAVQRLTCVAATDVDGQGAGGAQGGRPAVNHQNRQEVNILLVAVKA